MSSGWPFQKKLAKLGSHPVLWRFLRFVGGVVIVGLVIGVLANFLYAQLPQVWKDVVDLVSGTLLPWVLTFVALLCCIIVFPLWRRDSKNWSMKFEDLQCKSTEIYQLLVLDDSLMRLLPSMITITRKTNTREVVQNNPHASHGDTSQSPDSDELDLDKRMHNLLDRLLELTVKAFPEDVQRGILFRPDTNRKQLIIWEQYGWWVNEAMKGQARFDISGKPETKPGVAGDAFLNGETVIAHIRQENGQYTCDKDSYVFLGERNNPPSHSSLICVPITGLIPDSSVDADGRLGVICLDSSNPKLFDSPEIQEKLKLLSRHIAAALLIHDQLSQACSASACVFARRRPPAA